MSSLLRLDQVTVSRPGFRLSPVTIEVEPGECLFVAGLNGAGKSSLMAAIAGLLPIDSGTIRWGNAVWSTPDQHLEPWRRPCAMLLQEQGLWPHLSIREQCRLVANDHALDLESLGAELGVTALLDRRPLELSGGEAQRCALVRALVRDHPVVLLDEPYSAQHPQGIERVDAVIERLRAAERVLVVAGHRAPEGARTLRI